MEEKAFRKQYVAEIFKPAKKHMPAYRHVYASFPDAIWSIDLAFLDKDAMPPAENDGNSIIMTCIDIYSRYATAVPMRDKSAEEFLASFRNCISKMHRGLPKERKQILPGKIWADQEAALYSDTMKEFLAENDVGVYSTAHGAIIERFNRTLKRWLNMAMVEHATTRWVDLIDDVVGTYNTRVHRTLKKTPREVYIANVRPEEVSPFVPPSLSKPLLEVGDRVRVNRNIFNIDTTLARPGFGKGKFEKEGWDWSTEVFTVREVLANDVEPAAYRIRDANGEDMDGLFYEKQLQKTAQGEIYLVDTLLKKRVRAGKTEYLTRWLGYPESMATWEPAENVKDTLAQMLANGVVIS